MKPLEIKPQPHRTEVRENGRVCTKCKEFKTWDNYLRDILSSTGYGANCKPCRNRRK